MVTIHFKGDPFRRDLFNIPDEMIKGKHFKGWRDKADYAVTLQAVLQIDTTRVTDCEKRVSPNMIFLTSNQAIVNIFKSIVFRNKSKKDFNAEEAKVEIVFEKEVHNLLDRLNACRKREKVVGEWFINYSLNDRKVEVSKP